MQCLLASSFPNTAAVVTRGAPIKPRPFRKFDNHLLWTKVAKKDKDKDWNSKGFYSHIPLQDFYELLDECDSKRRPFNDRSFPPDISSLCYIPFRNM